MRVNREGGVRACVRACVECGGGRVLPARRSLVRRRLRGVGARCWRNRGRGEKRDGEKERWSEQIDGKEDEEDGWKGKGKGKVSMRQTAGTRPKTSCHVECA